jgi:uncharacterized membrane protein YccC
LPPAAGYRNPGLRGAQGMRRRQPARSTTITVVSSSGLKPQAALLASITRHLDVHDPERASLKSAARAAIVMPAVFAFADNVIGQPQTTIFSAFGSFSMLVLADFQGPPRSRLSAYLTLVGVGAALISLGTLCSRSTAAGASVTALVGFTILFAGLINRYFAAGAFAALLSFIIAVNVPASASAIPMRLEGWGLASAVALAAVMLLWPPRARPSLRPAATRVCIAIADLLQSELDGDVSLTRRVTEVGEAVASLRERFVATPYRPTGATAAAKALAFLVDELEWLRSIVLQQAGDRLDICAEENREAVAAAIAVLRACAARLSGLDERPDLERLVRAREGGIRALMRDIRGLPADRDDAVLVSAVEPSFRTRALSFATWEVGANTLLATGSAGPATDWGPRGRAAAPREVVRLLVEHARLQSVWFRNSVRGAAALTIAVYVAQRASLQHAFWVVLGTLSVLRSNALGTGSTILQAVAGTAAGILVGGVLVAAIGTNHGLLWAVLPIAVLLAAYAPRAISFTAGQAGFTVVLLVLFNIIQPTGWKVGLVRVEDVAIGFAISLGIGLLFWPRGARAALRASAADAYVTSADYFGAAATSSDVDALKTTATAAAHRLDDAYRQFLAEPGRERLNMESIATLVTGATRLRLAAHSLTTIAGEAGAWDPVGILDRDAMALRAWYIALADGIRRSVPGPPPESSDDAASREVLRFLDEAVADHDTDRIRSAVGATLASDHIGNLRSFEAHLARALHELSGERTRTPAREVEPLGAVR